MKIRAPQDFCAGLMFVAIGCAAIMLSRDYTLGSSARMGPGYFPTVLGGILIALGLFTGLRSLAFDGARVGRFNWKPLLFVLGGLALFGQALQNLGLAVAIFALIIVSALGGHEFKLKQVLLLAAILEIGSIVVFNYGLQLQFPVWPW